MIRNIVKMTNYALLSRTRDNRAYSQIDNEMWCIDAEKTSE